MKLPVYLACFLLSICTAQVLDGNPCDEPSSQESCDTCISASHLCTWCPYSPNDSSLRCQLNSTCSGDVTPQNPLPETFVTRDEPLTTSQPEDGMDAIQVSPQDISLSLRSGLSSQFNMTFRSLRNSPLDLYFLIDLSSSQFEVVQLMRRELPAIAEVVRSNISTNFRIGFGTFVDKPILPYSSSDYRRNNSQTGVMCRSFEECAPTYSFRNSQPLTDDVESIGMAFNMSSELSSNYDSPEGSFEALLQVAVCTNETGWRPEALHMVFLITDQGYHLAGDGRLAGIVKPNDGKCHLELGDNLEYEYTHALLQDYPSLFQIRQSLENNVIVPIFALRFNQLSEGRVNDALLPAYMRLIDDLSATQARAFVFEDSSLDNIIRVISESYERTVQSIFVNTPNVDGYTFQIKPVEGCVMRDGGVCELQFDDEVTFEVTVTLDDCLLAGATRTIQLLGPPFSFTTIKLNPLCQCPCTVEGPEINSTQCTSKGDLTCGICSCGPEIFGVACECNEEITECPFATLSSGATSTCSGLGICTTCGTCLCNEGNFGDACQCTDASCTCTNGKCTCGAPGSIPRCECNLAPESGLPFFQGSFGNPGNCECDPDACYNPMFPRELCHVTTSNVDGRDFCACNGCTCPDGFEDRDNTCIPQESCTTELFDCARCRLGELDNTTADDCRVCPSTVPYLGEDGVMPDGFSFICNYTIMNCDYHFFVSFNGSMRLLSFSLVGCTNTNLPWIITGSLVGAIIVIGLLFLIILKVLLLICDRIEYKKFTQELQDADFSPMDNPLYLTPQQDYQNPIRRPSKRSAPLPSQ